MGVDQEQYRVTLRASCGGVSTDSAPEREVATDRTLKAYVGQAEPHLKACRCAHPCRALRFRRGACRYASLADLYCAFGMTLLRGCYHQILGPRRHLPKLSNGLCRHAGAYVRLNVHLGWQAAESYVERSNAFALIPGHTLVPDCSAAEQPTIEDTSFARHASERGHGTLEGVPDNKLDGVPNALGWRLDRSYFAIFTQRDGPIHDGRCRSC